MQMRLSARCARPGTTPRLDRRWTLWLAFPADPSFISMKQVPCTLPHHGGGEGGSVCLLGATPGLLVCPEYDYICVPCMLRDIRQESDLVDCIFSDCRDIEE